MCIRAGLVLGVGRCGQVWAYMGKFEHHCCLNLAGVLFPDFSSFSRQNFQKFSDLFTRQFWILGVPDGCFKVKKHCSITEYHFKTILGSFIKIPRLFQVFPHLDFIP